MSAVYVLGFKINKSAFIQKKTFLSCGDRPHIFYA